MENRICLTLDNGFLLERTQRKHHLRMVFTDVENQQFYVAYNSLHNEILTDFYSSAMRVLGFLPVPNTCKRHLGRFKYIKKMTGQEPISNAIVPFEEIIIPSMLSAGAKVQNEQSKNCDAIIAAAKDLKYEHEEEKPVLIETIRQFLEAIEQNLSWEEYLKKKQNEEVTA